MSQISSIYDAWETVIEANLTAYTKIRDPYEPDANPEVLLRKGYGIAIGDGLNSERLLSCKLSVERTFNIILVNTITATPNNKAAMATLEKNLMEDQFTLINAVEKDAGLNGTVRNVAYQADSGIDFLEGDSSRHLLLETQFVVEYFEDLT